MTTPFQDELLEIQSQIPELERGDEETTKASAIEPLLNFFGWKTSRATEVVRQYKVACDKNDKIDYALQIDGERRVFIEAKKWVANLDNHVDQLLDYCNAAEKDKPLLAALTNGRQWRLYLPPVKNHPELRRFLTFDITTDKPDKVDEMERNFREFLARDTIKSMKKPPLKAYELWRQIIKDEKVMDSLSNAWNKIAKSQKEQAEVLSFVAKYHKVETEEEHLKNFLKSSGPLFNPVTVTPKQTHSKPTSFTFNANGKEETVFVKHWSDVHFRLCEIIYERKSDTFIPTILGISESWFSETNDNREGHSPLKGVGISVKKTGANAKAIKTLCSKVVARFDYSQDALTIQET